MEIGSIIIMFIKTIILIFIAFFVIGCGGEQPKPIIVKKIQKKKKNTKKR